VAVNVWPSKSYVPITTIVEIELFPALKQCSAGWMQAGGHAGPIERVQAIVAGHRLQIGSQTLTDDSGKRTRQSTQCRRFETFRRER